MGLQVLFAFSAGVASGIGFCWVTFLFVALASYENEQEEKRRIETLKKQGVNPAYLYMDDPEPEPWLLKLFEKLTSYFEGDYEN